MHKSRSVEESKSYPRFVKRVQALLIDGVVVPVAALGTLIGVSSLGLQGYYSAISAALIVFLLEPFMVSQTGGTIGHHLVGIRVISKNQNNNIGIVYAVIRFATKIVFGFLSLISVFITKKHQAVHDLIVSSIVVLDSPKSLPKYEVLKEREVEEPGYVYPSVIRRIIMILIYNVLLLIILGLLTSTLFSDACAYQGRCYGYEFVLMVIFRVGWLAGIATSIIVCWKCRLFGCMRKLESKHA